MKAITIVGSGMAGFSVAREFRKLDSMTPLRIITADDGGFYAKPMLSNAFALKKSAPQLLTQTASQIAEQYNLEMISNTRVLQIDSDRKILHTTAGEVSYSLCVLATGAQPIRLNIAGDGAPEILSINHLDDYRLFRLRLDQLASSKTEIRIAIIGAGLIGCEFADDLARTGFHIDLIDPHPAPLAALLPPGVAVELQKALQTSGVHFHASCTTESVTKNLPPQASRLQLTLSNGVSIAADLVLSAVGLRPDLHLAHNMTPKPLHTDRGICINTYGETSVPDIFALGDNAQYMQEDGSYQLMPYISPIVAAAKAIAHTMLGKPHAIALTPSPIIIKTPSYPIASLGVKPSLIGKWEYEQTQDFSLTARFYDDDMHLRAFALAPHQPSSRAALLAELAGSSSAMKNNNTSD